jgi:hypothetical protein
VTGRMSPIRVPELPKEIREPLSRLVPSSIRQRWIAARNRRAEEVATGEAERRRAAGKGEDPYSPHF